MRESCAVDVGNSIDCPEMMVTASSARLSCQAVAMTSSLPVRTKLFCLQRTRERERVKLAVHMLNATNNVHSDDHVERPLSEYCLKLSAQSAVLNPALLHV